MNKIKAQVTAKSLKIREETRTLMHKVTREVLLEIGKRIVDRSPVGDPTSWAPPYNYWPKGYTPGLFINNWQLGIDRIPQGTVGEPNPSGSSSLDRLSKVGRWPANHTYYIVNNLPYARTLEYGWSNQAPMGIVGVTKAEFPQIVREASARVRSANVAN